jgi:PhnB protein
MPKQNLTEQLDRIVQTLMTGPERALPSGDSKIDSSLRPLARIAANLCDLPREDFRARLKTDLQRRASMTTAAKKAVKPIREGFHTITPYLIVPGAAQLIEFMKEAFGGTEILRVGRPEGGAIMHAEVKIGDSMIELGDATEQFPARPAPIHLQVSDVDAVYKRSLEAGATSIYAPVDHEYGERGSGVVDAFGNHWYIATPFGGRPIHEGMRSVTLSLHPRGAAQMIDFLKEAFGAEETSRATSPDGKVVHASVRIGDSILEMGEAHGPYQPMPCGIHLYVEDTDALYERALRAGATSLAAPEDKPYGDRSAGVTDPFGNQWFIATHIKDVKF